MIDIAGNVARLRERIARAAERSGRPPGSVRLIAVSKTKPAAAIVEALRARVSDIGENYVQEAAAKIAAVGRRAACWHLIGHLQRNKAARAVELFDLIQTVDSLALADTLDRHAATAVRIIPVLVEVNVGGEPSKSGVALDQAEALVAAIAQRSHLRIEGLMTVPPPADDTQVARRAFARLRRLREQLQSIAPQSTELSMGMSDDFEIAIEEGATMVRIGRAIFGPREG